MSRPVLRINRGHSHHPKNRIESNEEEMSNKVLVLVTEDLEELETIVPISILRHSGVEVVIAGVNVKESVKLKNNVRLVPDVDFKSVADDIFDCVIIPGGRGAEILAKDPVVGKLVRRHFEQKKLVAAICSGYLNNTLKY